MSSTFHDDQLVLGEVQLAPGGAHVVRYTFVETTKLHALRFPSDLGRVLFVRDFVVNTARPRVPDPPFPLEQARSIDLPVAERGQELTVHLFNPSPHPVRLVLGADVTYVRPNGDRRE